MIGSETSSPGDGSARNKSADVISINGHMKGISLSGMYVADLPGGRSRYSHTGSACLKLINQI